MSFEGRPRDDCATATGLTADLITTRKFHLMIMSEARSCFALADIGARFGWRYRSALRSCMNLRAIAATRLMMTSQCGD